MVEKLSKEREDYVLTASHGTIVAFRFPSGRVKSAKIVRRSTSNRVLEVETEYGSRHVISFDDVIWVKSGDRWPKNVYKMLKGDEISEEREDEQVRCEREEVLGEEEAEGAE